MSHSARRCITLAIIALSVFSVEQVSARAPNENIKILAADGMEGDQFGYSVAISGTTAIVGNYQDHDLGTGIGSAYIIDTVTGQELFKLTTDDPEASEFFGSSVAISGTTAIVGYSRDNGPYPKIGSAYLFDTETGQQLFKLTASDGGQLGGSVSISGTTAIAAGFGHVYLFDSLTGHQINKLILPKEASADRYGFSVSISGTTAIIGAGATTSFVGSQTGSAYLFDTETGQLLHTLTASDAGISDFFGLSVAISGTTAIIGAHRNDDGGSNSGSAYVFNTETGQQLFKLTASDAAAGDEFGRSVAISGRFAIIGAWFHDGAGTDSGSAYLFDITTGEQLAKFTASDAAVSDLFGWSVAISGNTAVVGAYRDDDLGTWSGSSYLFPVSDLVQVNEDFKIDAPGYDVGSYGSVAIFGTSLFDTQTGQLLLALTGEDGMPFKNNRYPVAISGTTAIIGDRSDDDAGNNSGAAYLFDTKTGQQLFKLTGTDTAEGDFFGWSVAISGSTAIVGALGDDKEDFSGSARSMSKPLKRS